MALLLISHDYLILKYWDPKSLDGLRIYFFFTKMSIESVVRAAKSLCHKLNFGAAHSAEKHWWDTQYYSGKDLNVDSSRDS